MATVVKARYRSASSASGKAAAGMSSLDYFAHRPDRDMQPMDREILTAEGRYRLERDGEQARQQLSKELEASKGQYLHTLVLSSGNQNMTRLETERWARNVLEQSKIDSYMLVVHAGKEGHTQNPHAHVLVPTHRPLTVPQLEEMRRVGDREQEVMLKVEYGLKRDVQDVSSTPKGGGGKEIENTAADDAPKRSRQVDIQFGS